jgi:type II secretory pathway pseudopilin PulG
MSRQSGFSIVTLLFLAVALLAGLAFILIGSGPNVQGQMNAQKTAQLVAQAQLIVHRISKCATDYPNGDNLMVTGLHKAYPADANPGSLAVASLVCPGNSQNLWSGVDGVYPPASIADFGAWTYTNVSPAIIAITTSQPGAYSPSILSAAGKIGPAASATADTLTVKVIE